MYIYVYTHIYVCVCVYIWKTETEAQFKDLTSTRISGKWEQNIERSKTLKSIRRKFPGAKERSSLRIERVYPLPRRIKKDPLLQLSLWCFRKTWIDRKVSKDIPSHLKEMGTRRLISNSDNQKTMQQVFKVLRGNGFTPKVQNKIISRRLRTSKIYFPCTF